jgi:hypothetical protein
LSRRLLRIFVACSALLCIAILMLLAHSYRAWDRVKMDRVSKLGDGRYEWRRLGFSSSGGETSFQTSRQVISELKHTAVQGVDLAVGWVWEFKSQRENAALRRWGFGFGLDDRTVKSARGTWRTHELRLGHRLIALAFSVAPAVSWLRYGVRRRQWRLKHGMCLNCGYDLRASNDRCPECGTTISVLTKEKGASV